ncbi:MAG: DinB family protein [Actinomycetes bacterium]
MDLEKLMRHMAWSNQHLIVKLQELPETALDLKLTPVDWSVRELANHLILAAGGYAHALSQTWTFDNLNQEMLISLDELARIAKDSDELLRLAAQEPEAIIIRQRPDGEVKRARSTIISQSIHHATEHRAQISDTLRVHGIRILDLDEIDLWAYANVAGE